MIRSLITFFGILIAIFTTSSCDQQFNKSKTNKKTIKQTANQISNINDINAQNLNLNINWLETSIIEDNMYSLSLLNIISINGTTYSFNPDFKDIKTTSNCTQASTIDYDIKSTPIEVNNGEIYFVAGYSTCWKDNHLYLGMNLMGWNAHGIVQQLVLLDLTSDEIVGVKKELNNFINNTMDLPLWIESQFKK